MVEGEIPGLAHTAVRMVLQVSQEFVSALRAELRARPDQRLGDARARVRALMEPAAKLAIGSLAGGVGAPEERVRAGSSLRHALRLDAELRTAVIARLPLIRTADQPLGEYLRNAITEALRDTDEERGSN
jgi:hypothetical protein